MLARVTNKEKRSLAQRNGFKTILSQVASSSQGEAENDFLFET